jgi:hypothetical protein
MEKIYFGEIRIKIEDLVGAQEAISRGRDIGHRKGLTLAKSLLD